MADYLFRLKISTKSIYNQYSSSFFMYLLAAISIPIFYSFEIIPIALIGLLLIIDYLSSLSLFIEYYKENKDTEVLVFENEIVIKNKELARTISIDEIDQIRIFNSTARGRSINNAIILIDKFYYVRIRLKNREDFFLTCLLNQELDYILIELFPTLIKRDDSHFYNNIKKVNNLY